MKLFYSGRRWWLIFLLAILSGILYGLSFPKFELWFLMPFSVAILIYLSIECGPVVPFISGLSASLLLLYWLVPTMTVYGNLSYPFSILLYFILCFYLSIYWGLFGIISKIFHFRYPNLKFFLIPVSWVFLEFLKARVFTGFPWALIGYSLYKVLPLIQISDITGVYGVSFLVILAGEFLHEIHFAIMKKPISSGIIFSFLFTFIFTALSYLYGTQRISEIKEVINNSEKKRISLIQGNFEQDIKWSPEYTELTMSVYLSLYRESVENGAEMIVWPETAVPFFYQHDRRYKDLMRNLVINSSTALIFGSPAYTRHKKGISYHNRIYLINRDGKEFYYDKLHLVPFGEYIPLKKIFKFAKRFVSAMGDMDPGREIKLLPYDGHLIGGYICYEAIFPELVRLFKKMGAEIFVNITNDAWFGKTSAPYQHISMAAFRSVENRVWTARCANTGVSALITPYGEIKNPTPIFKRTAISGEVNFLNIPTFYSRNGDVFAWLCVFLTLFFLTLNLIQRRTT